MHEFANGDLSSEDVALLGELKDSLAESGSLPPEAVSAAKGAFSWRTIDADLATLGDPPEEASRAPTVAPAARTTRYLIFQLGLLRIDLEICS
jgi:hypothetical protein